MKWIVILRKDKYALLQSKSDTQYAVVSDYDPAQSEDWQWSSGTHFIYWNNTERKTICLQNALYRFRKGDDYMFPIITNEKQKAFEENCIKNKVGSDESECKIPCICGYYGRACRQMNDKADRMLCTGCALAEFSK